MTVSIPKVYIFQYLFYLYYKYTYVYVQFSIYIISILMFISVDFSILFCQPSEINKWCMFAYGLHAREGSMNEQADPKQRRAYHKPVFLLQDLVNGV